jgi:hypothetical protein
MPLGKSRETQKRVILYGTHQLLVYAGDVNPLAEYADIIKMQKL